MKVRLLWPVSHIFTVVCSNICLFKFFKSWTMLKMLKIGCFKLFLAKPLYLRYASRYCYAIFCSTVVKVSLLWPVPHIFTVVCSKICFLNFSISWKMLKMLKIGCFKQNPVSQVFLKVFLCNFLLNSGESQVVMTMQSHTYSQWFAAKFVFLNFQ